MGHLRASYFAIAAFLALSCVVLLIVALVLTNWQVYKVPILNTRIRSGLWGYTTCGSECSARREYEKCNKNDDNCNNFQKAIKTAKIGLIIETIITFLFFLYCLAKIPAKFKKVAEYGCIGWIILAFPFVGAVIGSVCWGLYYHYNPFRKYDGYSWGPCFWIALAGWICGFCAWLPRLIYRVH